MTARATSSTVCGHNTQTNAKRLRRMITVEHPLIQLLALIDIVWQDNGGGSLNFYSEQTMFKVYIGSLLKQLWSCRSLWRYLSGTPLVAQACGLVRIPCRRTLDRRLAEIGP